MLKNFFYIFVPSFAKVVVFALLAAYFLVEKHEYIETVPQKNCAEKIFSVRVAGFPWPFYTYADDSRNALNAPNLAFNILFLYLVACILVGIGQAGRHIFHAGSVQNQLAFSGSLVVFGLITFVSLRIFGEAWVNEAVNHQNPKLVSMLLLVGVPADAEIHNGKDFALKAAARIGNREIIQTLLDARAQVNRVDLKKQTALHEAVSYNRREMVELLLRAGADVQRADRDGKTPLHRACSAITAKSLLEAGANPRATDLANNTPPVYEGAVASITPTPPPGDSPPALAHNPNKAAAPKDQSLVPPQAAVDPDKALLVKLLGSVKRKLNCPTSVGGRYIHKGTALNFSTDASGTLKVWQNAQGFLYADCKQAGYYHILIVAENGEQQAMINLSQGKDTTNPLRAQSKETAIVHFNKKPGKAQLHWYFSSQPIQDLKKAASRDQLAEITQHAVEIQPVDTVPTDK